MHRIAQWFRDATRRPAVDPTVLEADARLAAAVLVLGVVVGTLLG